MGLRVEVLALIMLQGHVHPFQPRWVAVNRRCYYAAQNHVAMDQGGVLLATTPTGSCLHAFAPWCLVEAWKSSCSESATPSARLAWPWVPTCAACRVCQFLCGARTTALRRSLPLRRRAVEFRRSVSPPVLLLRRRVRSPSLVSSSARFLAAAKRQCLETPPAGIPARARRRVFRCLWPGWCARVDFSATTCQVQRVRTSSWISRKQPPSSASAHWPDIYRPVHQSPLSERKNLLRSTGRYGPPLPRPLELFFPRQLCPSKLFSNLCARVEVCFHNNAACPHAAMRVLGGLTFLSTYLGLELDIAFCVSRTWCLW